VQSSTFWTWLRGVLHFDRTIVAAPLPPLIIDEDKIYRRYDTGSVLGVGLHGDRPLIPIVLPPMPRA
jgi:hypothetical protein